MTSCPTPTKENPSNFSAKTTPMLKLMIAFKKINIQKFNSLFHTLAFESDEIYICLLG